MMNSILMSIVLVTIPTTGGDEGRKAYTNTIPPVKPIILESTKATLSFSISWEYHESTDSEKYVNCSSEFRHKLMDTFIGTPGLEGIDHIRFRNGSIDFDVVLNSADQHNLIQSLTFINDTVLAKLQNIKVWIDSVNITAMLINMKSQLAFLVTNINSHNICNLLVNPCNFGYECIIHDETALCQDKCYSNSIQCSNGGECYVDYKYNSLKCQCHDTDEYFFTGDRCEVGIEKVQPLSLSAKDYAIIACSAAGAVVLIIIVVHLIRCLRKINMQRKRKENIRKDDGKSNLSVAHVSVRMSQLNQPDVDNTTYMYDSGLPEMSRNHRVYRDPHTGDEAIIYQPTFMPIPLSRGSIERESVHYDHITRHPDYKQNENPSTSFITKSRYPV